MEGYTIEYCVIHGGNLYGSGVRGTGDVVGVGRAETWVEACACVCVRVCACVCVYIHTYIHA